MRQRSHGVKALAVGLAMVAVYCQYAAMMLIGSSSYFAASDSLHATAALALGPLFLALTIAAYVMSVGLWFHRHWSWAGATVVFALLVLASLGLAIASTSFGAVMVPAVAAAMGIWFMHRPAIRAELLGDDEPSMADGPQPRVKITRPVH